MIKTAAIGAAFLAGLSTGVRKDAQQIKQLWKEDRCFKPAMDTKKAGELLKGWHEAVNRSKNWINLT